jgi:hypothetical protein
MVYITRNYIRLFREAQTFMRCHRPGTPREVWSQNLALRLHRLKPGAAKSCANLSRSGGGVSAPGKNQHLLVMGNTPLDSGCLQKINIFNDCADILKYKV